MATLQYTKPYRTSSDLVADLETKGLQVCNQVKASNFLSKVNYFRFKIYLRPFLKLPNKNFKKGYSFEEGMQLYRFDNELRNYLFSVIGRIEIKLRSRLDQTITSSTNDPFWYLKDSYFQDINSINKTRRKLKEYFENSKDDYAKHYKGKYHNSLTNGYKQMPPFWMIAELATFGTITSIIRSLKKGPFQTGPRTNSLDIFAQEFGAKNLKELNNWLFLLRDVRNRCAHHSRVWNCNYRNPSSIPNYLSTPHRPVRPNRLYGSLALLHYVSTSMNLEIRIRKNIFFLINSYPGVKAHLGSAGFPSQWQFDPFWM
jgi:abortive infection bacteriophage resistance protein